MSSIDKPPVSIRIRLKYPDVETFVDKYATNISRGGMFIQSRVPQPVGTALRFEVLLQDDTPLLRGEGTVIWVKEYDAAHPTQVHGMGIRFVELDETSRAMLEQVLSAKSRTTRPRTETQEVRALASEAHAAEPSEAPQIDEGSQSRAAPIFEDDEEDDESGATMVQSFAALEGAVSEPTQREPLPSEPVPEPEPERPAPFATLLAEAAPVAEAAPERVTRVAVEEPAPATPSAAELAALAEAVESGGDGVSVALAMAEQVLGELCEAARIGEERILAVVQSARTWVASEGTAGDELEGLLAPAPPPAASLEEALAGLAERGVELRAPAVAGARRPVAPPAPATTPTASPRPATPSAPSPRPEAAPAPAQPLAPIATIPLHPAEAAAEPVEPPFDPSLLQAAARAARAAKQERNDGNFDLSDGRGATGEFVLERQVPQAEAPRAAVAMAPPPAEAAPAPSADPGWGKLRTVTELLDHGSSQVLQDMAQLAGRGELEAYDGKDEVSFVESVEETTPAEREPIEAAPVEAAPQPSGTLEEQPSYEEAEARPAEEAEARPAEEAEQPTHEAPDGDTALFAQDSRLEPEEAATEPFLEPESVDELSRELWKEVVDEAAEELDRLEMPDDDGPEGPGSFFPAEDASDPDQLTAPPSEARDDLYADEDLSESTQVTAMPIFSDRAPGAIVSYEPELPPARGARARSDEEGFQSEREPDEEIETLEPEPDLEPDLDLEVESAELEDALPPDPDLSSEVFETLAGLRDTLRERPEGATEAPSREPALATDPDAIPSLEDLAGPRATPELEAATEPAPHAVSENDEVHATDPDAPAPKKIKPARSGIFSRIFRKK